MAGEDDGLAAAQAKADLEKTRLEIEKLKLDRTLARHQLTFGASALEWFKAGSAFVALAGVVVTLIIGQGQLRATQDAADKQAQQTEENRAADRFEKALGHLAKSDSVGERLTGVAVLRAILNDGVEAHQTEALQNLINAIAHERSLEIQHAILDAFSRLSGVKQGAKDDALLSAIELDRNLTAEYLQDEQEKRDKEMSDLSANLAGKPASAKAEPDRLQRLRLDLISDAPVFPSWNANAGKATLDNVVKIINALVAAGGRNASKDWTRLYCERCDFSKGGDLGGQHFDMSYLMLANFAQAHMRGATLRNANLARASFFHSDLSGADLSWSATTAPADEDATWDLMREGLLSFPDLTCANLDGANLSGLPLIEFGRNFTRGPGHFFVVMPDMRFVTFDKNTRLDTVGVTERTTLADPAAAAYAEAPRNKYTLSYPPFGLDAQETLPLSDAHVQRQGYLALNFAFLDKKTGRLQELVTMGDYSVTELGPLTGWYVSPWADAAFWRAQKPLAAFFATPAARELPKHPPNYTCSQSAPPQH